MVCRGAPLWRNESGFLPITAKSVGVRRCVGLRRRLRRLDGRRHLAVSFRPHDAEVGVRLYDLIGDGDARLVVAANTNTANVVERVDRPLGAGDGHADAEVRSVDDLAAFVGATVAQCTDGEDGENRPKRE